MNKKTKQIIVWGLLALLAIITIIVIINWNAFVEGYSAGSILAE